MAELSLQSQIKMSNLELTSQLMQGTFNSISKISKSQSMLTSLGVNNNSGKLIYASEGDVRYKDEIDTNDDGVVTYNEYVKYVTDNLSAKNNIPKSVTLFKNEEDSDTGLTKFTVTNLSKVISSYLNASAKFPISLIEKEI